MVMVADMVVERDPETGAVYCAFGTAPVARTRHLSDLVLVDVDNLGDVIGVEFAGDPRRLTDDDWRAVLEAVPQRAVQLTTLR
jgi:uncharacterized protein YuzE